MMRPKYIFNAAVEPFPNFVCLRKLRRGQPAFDFAVTAQRIEVVLAGGRALARAEMVVGELLAIIGQHRSNPDRALPLKIMQNRAAVLYLQMRMRAQRVARSMATNWQRRAFGGKTVYLQIAEREFCGFRNSRTAASKSPIDGRNVLCRATASCAGVNVVWSRCGVWLRS